MMNASTNNYLARLRSLRLPKIMRRGDGFQTRPIFIKRPNPSTRDNAFMELRLDYLSHPGPGSA